MFFSALRRLHSLARPSDRRSNSRFRARLGVEPLEDRRVFSLAVGSNVDITQTSGSQAESTISINPMNAQNLFEIDTVSRVGHYSLDGGSTWLNSNMGGLPASIGDVQTAWDTFGNLYLTYLTSSPFYVVVAESANGGTSFINLTPTPISHSNADQPSITVGPGDTPGSQSVWVSWCDAFSGFIGIAAAGAKVTGLGTSNIGPFTSYYGILSSIGGDFGDVAVGPNGEVMVTYQSLNSGAGPDTLMVNTKLPGATSFGPAYPASPTNVGSFLGIAGQPNRSIDAEANLAWDSSGGSRNGWVYLVYTDSPAVGSSDTNIFVRHSTDSGQTWSAPVQVNDDTTTNSQFLPAIAVDQTNGDVAVTWYDARNSIGNSTVQLFGTVSQDGGLSFEPNVQISAGTTDATVPAAGTFNLGDYDKMDFRGGFFYRTWADNSNSTGNNPDGALNGLDIYTAKVTVTTTAAPPAVTPPQNQSVDEFVSQPFVLGSFADSDGGPWKVSVNWGDGTQNTSFTVATAGTLGSLPHTYDEDGVFAVSVTVTDAGGLSGAAHFQVVINEPSFVVSTPITVNGKKVKDEQVATFTHGNNTEPAADFIATINWGDGHTDQGLVSQIGGVYVVIGAHIYDKGGRHVVTTTVTEKESPAANISALALLASDLNPPKASKQRLAAIDALMARLANL